MTTTKLEKSFSLFKNMSYQTTKEKNKPLQYSTYCTVFFHRLQHFFQKSEQGRFHWISDQELAKDLAEKIQQISADSSPETVKKIHVFFNGCLL